jgi:hypothetical protein
MGWGSGEDVSERCVAPSSVDLRCIGLCIYILPIEKVDYMNSRFLEATAGTLVILVLICLLPASADGREDQGDGLSRVAIPRYVKTPAARPRTWLFLAVSAARCLAMPTLANFLIGGLVVTRMTFTTLVLPKATIVRRKEIAAFKPASGQVGQGLPWLPTWFIYAFLRRLATLEAVISLPTRPFPAMAILREQKSAPALPSGPCRLSARASLLHHTEVLAVFPKWRTVQPPGPAPACGLLFPKNGRQDVRSTNSALRGTNFPVSPRFLQPFCFNGGGKSSASATGTPD